MLRIPLYLTISNSKTSSLGLGVFKHLPNCNPNLPMSVTRNEALQSLPDLIKILSEAVTQLFVPVVSTSKPTSPSLAVSNNKSNPKQHTVSMSNIGIPDGH